MYQQESRNYSPLSKGARQNFVKKVYSVLSAQLFVTVCMVLINVAVPAFARFQARNMWLYYTSLVGAIVSLLALFLAKITKSFPANYVVLGVFTLCESYMVTYVCMLYTPDSVLLAAVATLSATLGLTYFAITTKQDFTSYYSWGKGILSTLIWIVMGVSLFNLLFLRSSFLVMAASALCAIIYSIYIVIDTQLILGGKDKELQLDDYVMGATILYVDIIALFLKILRLLGKKKDD